MRTLSITSKILVLGLATMLTACETHTQTTSGRDWLAAYPKTKAGAVSADGIDAAQSGPIGDNAETWLQADISSSGTLSFRWRVSCEYRYDMLTFYVDSTVYRSVSGETDWQDVSVFVPPGTHTFRWVYRKGKSGAAGADCGWVDEVNWTPGVPGAAWTLTVASTNGFGAPMPDVGTHSFTNGTVIAASVTSLVLVITNVERRLCSGWTRTGILPESGDGTATDRGRARVADASRAAGECASDRGGGLGADRRARQGRRGAPGGGRVGEAQPGGAAREARRARACDRRGA